MPISRKLQTFFRIADKYKRLFFVKLNQLGETDMFALGFHPRSVTRI